MKMMLDKKANSSSFLTQVKKMGHKTVETQHQHLAQEVLMNTQCNGGSRSFARETRALNMSTVAGHQKLTTTNWEPSLKLLLPQLDMKFKNSLSAILWLFSIRSKLEKWKGSMKGSLMSWPKTKKIIVLKCYLILCNNELFLNWMVSCNKKWISYYNQWCPAQWLDQAEALKHVLKATLAPEKVLVTLVVCCQSGPLQLSKFQQNHYLWEVCSHTSQKCAHDEMALDPLQTALVKSQSSPRQRLTTLAQPVLRKLNEVGYRVLSHPPYSPDL